MSGNEFETAAGLVVFCWDSGDDERHLVVTIEPENPRHPESLELTGELRDQVAAEISEGLRIEFDFVSEHHELVDGDGRITDGSRMEVLAVRLFDAED